MNSFIRLIRSLFSAISIVFIFISFLFLINWFISSDYYYRIKPFKVETQNIDNKNIDEILIIGSGKAIFSKWIEDQTGKVIYEYEDIRIDNINKNYIIEEINDIPDLPSGFYVVKGKIIHKPNPISISEITIILDTKYIH